jgi:uncharacterized membrane protein YcaP (DUF421 family)
MTTEFLAIIIRSGIIYLFIVFAIRLFGKREITQLSIIDLVFILLISNAVQNAMVGQDTTIWGGIIAAATLFTLHNLLEVLFFKYKRVREIIQGDPLMLIYQGKIMKKHLAKARLSQSDLEAAMREHGVKDVKDVDLAVLEVDGDISFLSGITEKHDGEKSEK